MKQLALLFWLFGIGLAQAQNGPGPIPVASGTGYPANAQFILNGYSAANTSNLSLLLYATPGKVNFVCGIIISGLGATALTNVVASVGALSGNNYLTVNYTYPAGVTVTATPVIVNFNPCLPGLQSNSGITLGVPGAAGNTSIVASIWGYQLTAP